MICVRFPLLVFLAFFSVAVSSEGQTGSIYDFDIKHWNSADGLSSNSVRAVSQDPLGYVWVGTLYGLNRFDGYHFTQFSTKTSRQLASNSINKLLLDQQGYMWVGTKAGLSGFDPQTLKFDRYPILAEVTSIVQVAPDEIWVAAENLFKVKQGKVSRVQSIKESVVQIEMAGDSVLISTTKFLYKLSPEGEIQKILLPDELQQHPLYDLSWFNDTLHFASESGYFHLDKKQQVVRCDIHGVDNSAIYKLFKDSSGNDWISGYNKLYHRHAGQEWQHISAEELGSSPWFSDIFEDRDHNIWLASFSEGLYRASPGKMRRVVGVGQQDVVVRSVRYSARLNSLLVATQTNVGLLKADQHFVELVDHQSLGQSTVYDFYDRSNQLWLGTDHGLLLYNFDDRKVSRPFKELATASIRVVQPHAETGLWFGGANGLYHYDGETLKAAPFNADLESAFVTVIEDQGQDLLVGTTSGLYWYQQEKLNRVGLGTPLFGAYITSVLTLADQQMLVATLDDGLFIKTLQGQWQQYDSSNGLPLDPVISLWYDRDSDYLWASSLKGVFRFRPPAAKDSGKVLHFELVLSPYDRQLGTAPGRCCNGAGHSKVAKWQDQLWFPSLKGLVAVPLQLTMAPDRPLQPLLQDVTGQKPYALLPEQQQLVLETSDRNISIRYSALEFIKANAIEFRYQLSGFDQEWQHVGQRREAIYTNLPPGSYQFVVQARYASQGWTDQQQLKLDLVVPRLFTETIVYKGLWALLLVLALYGLAWLWRRNAVMQQQELSKLVRQRTAELENSNSRLSELNEQLSQLTHKDTLTGLRNRRFLFEQLPKDVEQYQHNRDAMLQQGKCIALLQLDMDNFKSINDLYGNSAGDSVLQQISGLLLRESRGADYVVRFAGEQFVLVLRDVEFATVRDFALQLNQLVAQANFQIPDGRTVSLTCSIGYSCFPLELLGGQLISWEISLQLAEIALSKVKESGRNGCATVGFDPQVDAFEFEDSGLIDMQIEKLLADGLAWFEVKSYRP
ncbi:MAG: diguanylate cyclase [Gammaproteobacteria bacterium]|nr:diguanylate cyclase [Gammaproteobacteria bacterium]MBU2056710.1 diguanylate cyclase [Gammaproteobacteria bacterium]MBU2174047.1 diguanylate cyclase [Gammaproteobacteria bacterium]MBU2247353.1 diguanylate cyclase [Gammaproteobacteria bacterium]MBU2345057.1 diguanylate cyclase [Gammaproteobacteria bacterium]